MQLIDGENAARAPPHIVGAHGIPIMASPAAVGGLCYGNLPGPLAELAKAFVVHLAGLDVGAQGKQHLLHAGGILRGGRHFGCTGSVIGLDGSVVLEESQRAQAAGDGGQEDGILHRGLVAS